MRKPPFRPQASPMRPTSIASAGQGARASPGTAATPVARRSGGALRLLDETLDGGRELGAVAGPVLDAVERDPQRLLAAGRDRVVETDALDEAAVAAQARIGDDDVEEGALLRAAAGEPDDDHERVLGCGGVPAKNRAL